MTLTATDRGTGTHNTGATTLVPGGRSATLAVGSLGVFCISLDNEGSGGNTVIAPSTWTDAKNNVWTRRQNALYDNGAASAGIEMAIYTAPITVALLTTDLGTITWAGGVSPVAKAWTWYEITGSVGTPVYSTGGTIAGATAANAQVITASVLVGDAVIAGYFSENVAAVTGDSDSTNGSWAAQQTATVGTTTSGVRIATQPKVQTTTASTQSYDVTVNSQDRIAGYIMVHEQVAYHGDVAFSVGLTVAAAGTRTKHGDVAPSIGVVGAVAGTRGKVGAVAGTLGLVGAGSASAGHHGAVAVGLGLSGAGSAIRGKHGDVASILAVEGTGTGHADRHGDIAATLGVTGTAEAIRTKHGDVVAPFGIQAATIGSVGHHGNVAAETGLTGEASGTVTGGSAAEHHGDVTALIGFAGTADAHREHHGQVTATIGLSCAAEVPPWDAVTVIEVVMLERMPVVQESVIPYVRAVVVKQPAPVVVRLESVSFTVPFS